ncbi:MAG: DNA-binding protein [Rhodospirillales bacterium]|nr:DNA-binding protein [Rhodospirillales bacterium]
MAIIGVMGSSKAEWPELAAPLGVWLAGNGYDLLTGGGQGVMLSAARAFFNTKDRTGRSIGILPSLPHPKLGFMALTGYPNPFIDLPILTPLPRREAAATDDDITRNYINILTSDVIIALPGERGTLDEIRLARRFSKPLLCFGLREAFGAVPEGVEVTSNFEVVQEFIRRFPFH